MTQGPSQEQMGFMDQPLSPPNLFIAGTSIIKHFHMLSLVWPSQGQCSHSLASSVAHGWAVCFSKMADFFFSRKKGQDLFSLWCKADLFFIIILSKFLWRTIFFSSCLYSVLSTEHLCNLKTEVNYVETRLQLLKPT